MKKCAYSVCNQSYLHHAVVSLLSVRKWSPSTHLHLITTPVTHSAKAFLNRYTIKHHEIPEIAAFEDVGDYPKECFLWFLGPAIFNRAEYSLSIYLDPDVYCNADPFESLPEIETLAGVATHSIHEFFGEDVALLSDRFGIRDDFLRVQSGVIYINNKAMVELDFEQTAERLYAQSKKMLRRKLGDDGLFALMQFARPELASSLCPPNTMSSKCPRSPHKVAITMKKLYRIRSFIILLENHQSRGKTVTLIRLTHHAISPPNGATGPSICSKGMI